MIWMVSKIYLKDAMPIMPGACVPDAIWMIQEYS
jgi:hypothetical protein